MLRTNHWAATVVVMAAASGCYAATSGFTGDYAPEHWALQLNNSNGAVDINPSSLELIGGDEFLAPEGGDVGIILPDDPIICPPGWPDWGVFPEPIDSVMVIVIEPVIIPFIFPLEDIVGPASDSAFERGLPGETIISITVPTNASMSFAWDDTTQDGSFYDPAGYSVDGVFFQLTDDFGFPSQSGLVELDMLAGQTFGFEVHSVDDIFGGATLTISDFTVSDVPEPATLGLLAAGGVALLPRRRRFV